MTSDLHARTSARHQLTGMTKQWKRTAADRLTPIKLLVLFAKVALLCGFELGVCAIFNVAGWRWWCSKPLYWAYSACLMSGGGFIVCMLVKICCQFVSDRAPLRLGSVFQGWHVSLAFSTRTISAIPTQAIPIQAIPIQAIPM